MSADAVAELPMLLGFAFGYLAILATPGPNMLAIGALAALRGFRDVLPFCLGIALGAALLALLLRTAFASVVALPDAARIAQALGAALLLLLALRLIAAPTPREGTAGEPPQTLRRRVLVGLATGLFTAASNPLTAAYFAAQFLGPLGRTAAITAALWLVPLLAFSMAVAVAALFANPLVRRVAVARHRLVCRLAGLSLAAVAAMVAAPLVLG